MSNLIPVDPPCLLPLRSSFEENQLESELKTVFITVFENMVRARERELNLYGMAHLGDEALVGRNLQGDGLAVFRRDAARMRFLLKAWRARNPKRGTLFLKKYLQTVWPNEWSVDQFWHPVASAALYPTLKAVNGNPETDFLTSRLRVGVTVGADDGTGLIALKKALRSTLAARIVLELVLTIDMENANGKGFAFANGAASIIPLYSAGRLRTHDTFINSTPKYIKQGAVIGMPVNFGGVANIKRQLNITSKTPAVIKLGTAIGMPVQLVGKLKR